MTVVPGITIRSATEADAEEIRLLLATSFGFGYEPPEQDRLAPVFAPGGALVAVDGDRIVGHTNSMRMTLTVPGERTVPACGIAGVGVAPTHRRRGILRAMYTEQHRRTEADGIAITIFTASRATIYGRFGYGPAIRENAVRIDRRFAEFLPSTPDPGGVEMVLLDAAADRIRSIYDRWRRLTPGAQVRPETSWAKRFDEPADWRGGGTSLFALVHPDGYVLYRYHHHGREVDVEVVEMRVVTADAYAALWRTVLGLDLVTHVEAVLSDNEALPYLLTDSRLVRTTSRYDALWLRLMDVPAALAARGYRCDLDVVLTVSDPFRDAGGTFALIVRNGVAECVPTTRAADIELGIDVLAGMYLGAYPARAFAAANRLQAKDPARLRALDEAFGSEQDAALGWFF
ncbi:GNAT family N-acetyltransferase [Nocardia sp. NPDC050710]|uniref:GNAT family N-acetyltransferase n=1 Tax=Nocardia sp. NPDC050710 TaxID=3157220 RepID=UPI0033F7BBDA